MLSIIAAIGKNRELGFKGELLWHLPNDFLHFKKLTTGHSIIMGRKTYESIGKPLPHRTNIIITRSKEFIAEGCEVVNSLDEALEKTGSDPEVFVIGGAEIYNLALPKADRVYLTCVEMSDEADAFFPELKEHEWQEVSEENYQPDDRHKYAFTFKVFEKI